jgi:probable phosphoglycerate mutase
MSSAPVRGAEQVVLVRHAETEWSLAGRHTGRTDIPLTDEGRAHADGLRERLSGWSFELVLVSPLRRAVETCKRAGLAELAQPRTSLLEWDYGDYEGLTNAEITAARGGWSLWRDGCPGGEGPEDVGKRADAVIAELQAASGAVAIFSHGHMLRVLGARWIALGAAHGQRLGLSTAALSLLAHEHGARILSRWNDTGSGPFAAGGATRTR